MSLTKRVLLKVDGIERGSALWTAHPTLAVNLQSSARSSLKRLQGGEKIIISSGVWEEAIIFSRNEAAFKQNIISGLKELDFLLRKQKPQVFTMADIALQ